MLSILLIFGGSTQLAVEHINEGVPFPIVTAFTESHFINNQIYYDWLKRYILPRWAQLQKKKEHPRLLVHDVARAHSVENITTLLSANNVRVEAVPPLGTMLASPLDRRINAVARLVIKKKKLETMMRMMIWGMFEVTAGFFSSKFYTMLLFFYAFFSISL